MRDADRARLMRRRAEILDRISRNERVPEKTQHQARRAADAARTLAEEYEARTNWVWVRIP